MDGVNVNVGSSVDAAGLVAVAVKVVVGVGVSAAGNGGAITNSVASAALVAVVTGDVDMDVANCFGVSSTALVFTGS